MASRHFPIQTKSSSNEAQSQVWGLQVRAADTPGLHRLADAQHFVTVAEIISFGSGGQGVSLGFSTQGQASYIYTTAAFQNFIGNWAWRAWHPTTTAAR
jgi:hypothetical protein